MQDDREKRVRLPDPADVDDAGALQFLGENVDDEHEYVIIEGPESAVDEHPNRLLNQDARNRNAQLLVLSSQSPRRVSSSSGARRSSPSR